MEYCPTEQMWCDILNKPNQGALYGLYHSHLINVPVYYDDEVKRKSEHPALLNNRQDNKIKVPTCNRSIPKSDPSPVRRSVLGGDLEEVRWGLTQVPQQKGFGGSRKMTK